VIGESGDKVFTSEKATGGFELPPNGEMLVGLAKKTMQKKFNLHSGQQVHAGRQYV
jgi:hypothetical protein